MDAVADVALSSTRNPRVRAAAALRDRRARDEAGLTLDRRRPRARAGDRRRGARSSRSTSTRRGSAREPARRRSRPPARPAPRSSRCARIVLDRLAYGDRGDGIVAVARIPDTSLDGARRCRPDAAGRRRRGRREAGQPGRGAAVGRRRRRGRRDRRGPAHRPVQPERDPRVPGHGVRAPGGRRAVRRRARRGCGRPGVARRRRRGSTARSPYTDVDLRGAGGDRARQRGDRADRRLVRATTSTAVRLPMLGVADSLNVSIAAAVLLYEARRQRDVGPGRLRACRPSTSSIIGAGPAGEGAAHKARELGATVAIVDRRWFGGSCPHIGCVPSKALLHAAERHHVGRGLLVAARLGAARLHGQPPGRAPPSPTTRSHVRVARGGRRRDLPRRGPDHRAAAA